MLDSNGAGFNSQEFHPLQFQDAATRKACRDFLGYDPAVDLSLKWVFDEAMRSALPPGWFLHRNASTGRPEFVNVETHSRRPIRPFAASLKQKFDAQKAQLASQSDTASFALSPPSSAHSTSDSIDRQFARDDQRRPFAASSRSSSDHRPFPLFEGGEISDSIDREFEVESLVQSHAERLRALKLRQSAELSEEKHVLAVLRKRRKEHASELQRLEADRLRVRALQEEASAALAGATAAHDAVVGQLRESHERELAQLRLRQQGEVEQLVGEIEVVRGERRRCGPPEDDGSGGARADRAGARTGEGGVRTRHRRRAGQARACARGGGRRAEAHASGNRAEKGNRGEARGE
jgi:hypothetical protein